MNPSHDWPQQDWSAFAGEDWAGFAGETYAIGAAGILSLCQESLRQHVAGSPTWQALCGVDNAAAAALRLYHESLPPPAGGGGTYALEEMANYRPYGLIYLDEQGGFHWSRSSSDLFRESGKLRLHLEVTAAMAGESPTADAILGFRNNVGLILQDMAAAFGTPGYLDFNSVTVEDGPYFAHPKRIRQEGPWMGIDLGFEFGVRD